MEIRSLNTIRGLAALIVVISHFSNTSGLWGKVLGNGAGPLGVMLFFLLSGFLMTYLYWGKRPTLCNLLSYTASRAARVIPLYFVVVLLSFTTSYVYDVKTIQSLISHLLFLHGESVLWTIPPEIQFYVLFGLSWLLLSQHRKSIPLVISLTFVTTFMLNYKSGTFYLLGLPITASIVKAISYFTLGCIFGGFYKHRKSLLGYQSHWYLLTLVLVPALYPSVFMALFGFEHGMWKDVGILAIVGLVFFSVVYLVPDHNPLLENKFGDFFGRISYSLYLLHLPVLRTLTDIGWTKFGAVSLAAFIALASLVAWLSFAFVEAPCRKAIRAVVHQRVAGVQSTARAGNT